MAVMVVARLQYYRHPNNYFVECLVTLARVPALGRQMRGTWFPSLARRASRLSSSAENSAPVIVMVIGPPKANQSLEGITAPPHRESQSDESGIFAVGITPGRNP